MAGRVEGKVAVVTGAARGMGRSHAVRLAEEGADIIALDALVGQPNTGYAGASSQDMEITIAEVEKLGRRIFFRKADIRDQDEVRTAIDEGVAELGKLDIVVANAGIAFVPKETVDIEDSVFMDMLDVNVAGAWRTAKFAIPHLRANGAGSIVLTSSIAGLVGYANSAHYTAAKHAVMGLTRALAIELAPNFIRVNAVLPTTVDTPMTVHPGNYVMFRPDLENPTKQDMIDALLTLNPIPVPWIEPRDVSNAVLYLASDEARYVTGAPLAIDAGFTAK